MRQHHLFLLSGARASRLFSIDLLAAFPLYNGDSLAPEANASEAGLFGEDMSDSFWKGLQAIELLLGPALDC